MDKNEPLYGYTLANCDCCRFLIGYAEYTRVNKHDTQLFICEDCLPKEQIKEVDGKWIKPRW